MVMAITALTATSAGLARAQSGAPSNPWYVPPSFAAPSHGGGFYSGGNAGGYSANTYAAPGHGGYAGNGHYTTNSLPQHGLGAGYQPQWQPQYQPQYQPLPHHQPQYQPQYQPRQQAEPTYQPPRYEPQPQQARPGGRGYAAAYPADRAIPGPYSSGAAELQPYQPYAPPPAPIYRAPEPQPFGNYPPLGGDPTLEEKPRAAAPEQRSSSRTTQAAPAPLTAPPAGVYDPALAGPTTLSPYGVGVPLGTPYGGFSPFPGLPFW